MVNIYESGIDYRRRLVWELIVGLNEQDIFSKRLDDLRPVGV